MAPPENCIVQVSMNEFCLGASAVSTLVVALYINLSANKIHTVDLNTGENHTDIRLFMTFTQKLVQNGLWVIQQN